MRAPGEDAEEQHKGTRYIQERKKTKKAADLRKQQTLGFILSFICWVSLKQLLKQMQGNSQVYDCLAVVQMCILNNKFKMLTSSDDCPKQNKECYENAFSAKKYG